VKYPNLCKWQTSVRYVALALSLTVLANCALPAQGPSVQEVLEQAEVQEYELVPVTDDVAKRLSTKGRHGFSPAFLNAPVLTSNLVVGVGDRLNVRIFEAGQGGLFSSDTGNGTVSLPNVTVGPDGLISLPYVGTIQARGQTPRRIEQEIVDSLQGKAIEPQSTVEIALNANNSVTIMGAVVRPTKLQMNLRGERLSAALVAAGGARSPAHEISVKITRRGQTSTASLERIQSDSRQDIALRNDDTITVLHNPESYTIMGSVNRPGDVPFSEPSITLLEAIGKASGLLDVRADSGNIFLYRREQQQVLGAHGIARKPWWDGKGITVPTVYVIDFSAPKALFIAQTIQMRDGDTIYVANASAVALRKALSLFGLGAITAANITNLTD
jgi:polysaccharide export outer membrane protein